MLNGVALAVVKIPFYRELYIFDVSRSDAVIHSAVDYYFHNSRELYV